jgi:drug/metabolite transporter (DMT)-like permease
LNPAAHLGDLCTVASTLCFASSNITVARGSRPGADDNGAFISLLITTAIATAAWIAEGVWRGFEPVTTAALAWFAGAGVFTAFVGRVFFYAAIQRVGAMRSSTTKRLLPFFAVMLGVGVLGERFTGGMAIGMVLIVASFAVLLRGGRMAPAPGESRGRINSGYVYGAVSAFGYAFGYLLRKLGLAVAHDAFLGAAVGCLVGTVLFAVTGLFNRDYARAVRATFARPNPWLVAAGVLSSAGQIFYFLALNYSPMARVALVSSMEVFVTLALGATFLRHSETLTASLVFAAFLGFAGAALVVTF